MKITTTRYIRKPLYVDAVRVTAENLEAVAEWCDGTIETVADGSKDDGKQYIKVRVHNPMNPKQTKAFVGDWVLYAEKGYKIYTNRAFIAVFDEAKEDQLSEAA